MFRWMMYVNSVFIQKAIDNGKVLLSGEGNMSLKIDEANNYLLLAEWYLKGSVDSLKSNSFRIARRYSI